MREYKRAAHVKWVCKYHIVFIPKYRKKKLFGNLRHELWNIFHQLCRRKGIELVEGHIKPDHVHMLNIPPKFSVSMAVGFIKGKSAIMIHNSLKEYQRDAKEKKFWARGYCVSTVGLDEKTIREYIQDQ